MSDFLASVGVLVAAGASAASILLPAGRLRSVAMLLAIALFPILILGDQWHTQQIVDLRDHTSRIAALLAVGLAIAVGALAFVFRRWPLLMPLAIVAALPFRVPLHAGGDTANLLVPLYLVIAGPWSLCVAGTGRLRPRVVGRIAAGGTPPPTGPAGRAAPVAAAGSSPPSWSSTRFRRCTSGDFSKGLQNVCFFLVPFTVAYALLATSSGIGGC